MRRTYFLLALLLAACHREPQSNVVIVDVESLRVDRLGAYGNSRGITPFLDTLAQRGTIFVNAFAPSSATAPSVASLMTSRDPRQHAVTSAGATLAPAEQTFAELLEAHGFRAAGFSGAPQISQWRGYAQGFQEWHTDGRAKGQAVASLRAQALDWLSHLSQVQSGTLLYFHLVEPRMLQAAAEPYRSRFVQPAQTDDDVRTALMRAVREPSPESARQAGVVAGQLYDGTVAAFDEQLRGLFDALSQRGVLERAIIIVTADHGTELFEHGQSGDEPTLFQEMVRIPLIVIAPGYRGARRVDTNVSLLDVAPTLIDLLGYTSEPRFEGESLVSLLEPESGVARQVSNVVNRRSDDKPRDLLLRLDFNGTKPDRRAHSDGIIRWNQKLLLRPDGHREVYDLKTDPSEQTANAAASEGIADLLADALQAQTTTLKRRAVVR